MENNDGNHKLTNLNSSNNSFSLTENSRRPDFIGARDGLAIRIDELEAEVTRCTRSLGETLSENERLRRMLAARDKCSECECQSHQVPP